MRHNKSIKDMRTLKEKLKKFIADTDGAEFLEVAAIIIGTIALVGVIVIVFESVQNAITKTGNELDIP